MLLFISINYGHLHKNSGVLHRAYNKHKQLVMCTLVFWSFGVDCLREQMEC